MDAEPELDGGLERDFESEIRQWKTWVAIGIERVQLALEKSISSESTLEERSESFVQAERLLQEMKREAVRGTPFGVE